MLEWGRTDQFNSLSEFEFNKRGDVNNGSRPERSEFYDYYRTDGWRSRRDDYDRERGPSFFRERGLRKQRFADKPKRRDELCGCVHCKVME